MNPYQAAASNDLLETINNPDLADEPYITAISGLIFGTDQLLKAEDDKTFDRPSVISEGSADVTSDISVYTYNNGTMSYTATLDHTFS